jgi:hypothetical protein
VDRIYIYIYIHIHIYKLRVLKVAFLCMVEINTTSLCPVYLDRDAIVPDVNIWVQFIHIVYRTC